MVHARYLHQLCLVALRIVQVETVGHPVKHLQPTNHQFGVVFLWRLPVLPDF